MVTARSGANAVTGAVETGVTLRDNGQHPVKEWLRVAQNVIPNRAELLVRGAVIRASWQTLGGRP